MPIYEFSCNSCRRDSEVLVRSSDWTGTPCPHCGSTRLTKKLSVFASTSGGGGSPECADAPACGMNPASCGSCCGGGPHSH